MVITEMLAESAVKLYNWPSSGYIFFLQLFAYKWVYLITFASQLYLSNTYHIRNESEVFWATTAVHFSVVLPSRFPRHASIA